MTDIEITQADRDAAAKAWAEDNDEPLDCHICEQIRAGYGDNSLDVIRFARHRMEERAAIVAWLKKENGLCDCFARSEGECACGAWDDYKTVPIERIWQAIEAGEHLK